MNDTVLESGTDTNEQVPSTEKSEQYVTFLVGDKSFGVVIVMVREIRQWSPTTALPNQMPYTRGVLNLRGTVVPVHDLRARLGGALTEATENHVVVIASVKDQIVGVLVDAVSDIVNVNASSIRPVPSTSVHDGNNCISGLVSNGDEMVALLDLEALFVQRGNQPETQN